MMENILDDLDHANGLKSVCLRYFKAAGANPEGELDKDHDPETHLIPLVLYAALGPIKGLTVFGKDYPTEDGTCMRDYIHINELAQAHSLALLHLMDGGISKKITLETAMATPYWTSSKLPVRLMERILSTHLQIEGLEIQRCL